MGDVMNVWSSRRIVVEWTCGRRVSERCAEANRCAAVGHEARARRRENRVDEAGRVGRMVDGRPPPCLTMLDDIWVSAPISEGTRPVSSLPPTFRLVKSVSRPNSVGIVPVYCWLE